MKYEYLKVTWEDKTGKMHAFIGEMSRESIEYIFLDH